MDPNKQVYLAETSGWQRGLYRDIIQTMGWYGSPWRVLMYHEPRLTRYVWGQIKPIVQTREFAAFEAAWRDTLISAVEPELPQYGPHDVDVTPSEFTELQAQLARFDYTIPRHMPFFEIMDRRLNGRDVGTAEMTEAATSPYPASFGDNRGSFPSLLPMDDAREVLQETIPEAHRDNFGEMVPSAWRCYAQWPQYLDHAWTDLESLVDSEAFEAASEDALSLVDTYVDRISHTPQVDPQSLTAMGFSDETVDELQDLFAMIKSGADKLTPLVPIHAETVDAAGERHALKYP